MYLMPAIDILDGRVVRLEKGDYNKVTVYNDDPLDQAKRFEADGAAWVHVVDLNGAKSGNCDNIDAIERIAYSTSLHVEVGGGLRNLEALDRLAQAHVARMVLGTALVRDPEFAAAALDRYKDMLAAGIDAKKGEVAVSGWLEGSGISAEDLARNVAQAGFTHLIYTDISRDGMQTGIDIEPYVAIAQAFTHPVIASGGVASLDDIRRLAAVSDSIEAVIAGRAIYEGAFSVSDGIAACSATCVTPCATPSAEN